MRTGDAPPYEKFLAWARTAPQTLRNPLYHWTHLELQRYFGIDDLLDESTAPAIWEKANAMLATSELRTHGILQKFSVKALCTTDDPADDLDHHKTIAASGLETKVFPCFRPDKALTVHLPESFNQWVARLEAVSNVSVGDFNSFLDALKSRHDFFNHKMGGRLSDRGIDHPGSRISLAWRKPPASSTARAAARRRRPKSTSGLPSCLYDADVRTLGRGAGMDQAAPHRGAAER